MRALGLAIILAIATSCQSPTQLVVLVDSDFEVPAELAAVQVIVSDQAGETAGAELFDLSRFGLPMSFGIEGGDLAGEQIRILFQGLTPSDELLVERAVSIGFIEGERRLLPIYLLRSCGGATCGAEQTCTEDGCASPFVDVESLAEIEPGDETLFDAGLHPDAGRPDAGGPDLDAGGDTGVSTVDAEVDTGIDSGPDGGVDAGPDAEAEDADAGLDAGRPDTGLDAGPDGGRPDAGGGPCTSDFECGPNLRCADSIGEPCAPGGTTCECRLSCDAFVAGSVCPPNQACYYRFSTNDGVCLDRDLSTASNQRSPCTFSTDCDQYENFYCRPFENGPAAECTSGCQDDAFCQARVPGTFCDLNPIQPIGLCLEPGPQWTDVSSPCTADSACQSGACVEELMICSSSCAGLQACPSGSFCAFGSGADAWCMRYCTTDADCANNPQFTCRQDLGAPICFYRCDNPNAPCQAGQVCDSVTGRCM